MGEIAGQDTESRGVIFLCGYIFKGKKSPSAVYKLLGISF